MTSTITTIKDSASTPFALKNVEVSLIGESAAWFTLEKNDRELSITPRNALPCRCTIRPVAIFENEGGFIEANPVMGRLIFSRGATELQSYTPFTRDPRRRLVELVLPVETMPEDDRPNSPRRWVHAQAAMKRLASRANLNWNGLPREHIEKLVRHVLWPEPLDGCALHALATHFYPKGKAIIEIGSFRGASLSVLALALDAAGSDCPIFSVDPHNDMPFNADLARLALRQIGHERRLVQLQCTSDEAVQFLRPGISSMIFVDGDHAREQVVSDFEHYFDLLAPGGCMAFHDYGCGDHNGLPEAHPGVRKAIDEVILPSGHLEPLFLAHTLFAFLKC
jgi:predicted O-methyltransferase YrrM